MTAAEYEIAINRYRGDTGKMPVAVRDLMVQPKNVAGWNGPYIDRYDFACQASGFYVLTSTS